MKDQRLALGACTPQIAPRGPPPPTNQPSRNPPPPAKAPADLHHPSQNPLPSPPPLLPKGASEQRLVGGGVVGVHN